jgi:hypothetical protein
MKVKSKICYKKLNVNIIVLILLQYVFEELIYLKQKRKTRIIEIIFFISNKDPFDLVAGLAGLIFSASIVDILKNEFYKS